MGADEDAIAADVVMAADLAWAGVQVDTGARASTGGRLGGSLVHITDLAVGAPDGALRAWLVFTITTESKPRVDALGDFGYNARTSRSDAREGALEAGEALLDQLSTLSGDQLLAFTEQDTGHDSASLVARIKDTWHLPRLAGVNWVLTGVHASTALVSKRFSGYDGPLRSGDRVLLAGDEFWDLLGTVIGEDDDTWKLTLEPRSPKPWRIA